MLFFPPRTMLLLHLPSITACVRGLKAQCVSHSTRLQLTRLNVPLLLVYRLLCFVCSLYRQQLASSLPLPLPLPLSLLLIDSFIHSFIELFMLHVALHSLLLLLLLLPTQKHQHPPMDTHNCATVTARAKRTQAQCTIQILTATYFKYYCLW